MSKSNFVGNSPIGSRKRRVAYLSVAGAAVAALHQSTAYGQTYSYTPISINSSSYNESMIIPANAPLDGAANYISASVDSGTPNPANNVWFQKGYDNTTLGLPAPGTTFNGSYTATGVHTYTMPSSYGPGGSTPNNSTNDVLFVGDTGNVTATSVTTVNSILTGTFTFATPEPYAALSILGMVGNGPGVYTVTANYANGSHAVIDSSLSVNDWYTAPTAVALYVGQRASPSLSTSTATTFSGNGTGSTPGVWENDITGIADNTDPISSVTLTFQNGSSTARGVFFAISGIQTQVLTYTGTDPTNPGVFDTSSLNFANTASGAVAYQNTAPASILFPDQPAGPTNITVGTPTGGITPLGMLFTNNVSSYNFSGGPITGTGTVTLSGGGTVSFAQTIPTGTLTVNNGSSLFLNSTAVQSVASLNGNANLNIAGTINIGSGGVFTGSINGNGSVVFNGSMTFNTASAEAAGNYSFYSGTTAFNSGSVTINSPNSFGFGQSTLLFNGGGISPAVPLTGLNAVNNTYQISSGGTLTLSGTNALELSGSGLIMGNATVSVTATTASLTLDNLTSNLASGSVLSKTGVGTLYLTASGGTNFSQVNVSAGILNFTPGSLGSSGTINLSGGTLQFAANTTSPEDITTTHTLLQSTTSSQIDTNGNTVTFAGPITAASTTSGQLNKIGGGTLILTGSSTLFDFVASGGNSNAASPVISTVTITGPTASLTVASPSNGFGIGYLSGDNVVVNITNGASVNAGNVSTGSGYGGLNIADQAGTANDPDIGVLNISGATTTAVAASVLVAKGYSSSTSAANSVGVLNMSGGTLTCLNNSGVTPACVFTVGGNAAQGGDGTGLVIQTGGTINARPGVTITGNAGSIGTYNLAGGTLNTPNIVSGSGTSTFLFNGGMLNYTGTAATSFTLITSTLNVAQIQAGGLNLNQSSYPVTIAANLSSNGSAANPDGGINLVGTGAVTLSGNDLYYGPTNLSGGLIFAQSGTTNLSGAISGSGYVNQSGSGITYLSGNNTYTGGTNITSGIVVALSPTAFGATTTNVTFSGTGTIGLPNDSAGAVFSSGYTFNKEAISFLNYTSSLTFTNVTNLTLGAAAGTPSTLTGSINGATTLTYVGPNTLYLTNPSSNFSGGTNLAQGTLNFVAGALGTGPITLNGGILQYAGGNTQDVTTSPGLILGTGGGVDVGTNTVTFAGNITNYSSANVNTGAFTVYGTGGTTGTLNLTGSIYPTSFFARAPYVTLIGSSAVISATAYSDVAVSAGDNVVFTMDNGATFTDTSDFNVADTSAVGTTTTMGVFNINTTTATGTSLTAANIYVGKGTSGNFNAFGVVNQTGGTVAVSSSSGNFQVGVYGTGTYNQYGGNVSAGTIKLGVNTSSIGVYNLTGGTLTANSITGGSGTSVLYLDGGTVSANASGTLISGLTSTKLGPVPTTINTNAYAVTISQGLNTGVTTGTDGGLIKTGTGTLSLSGSGNYSGGTVVSGGTVTLLSATGAGTGPITLSGGTLSVPVLTTAGFNGSTGLKTNYNTYYTAYTPAVTGSGTSTSVELTNGTASEATSAFLTTPVKVSDLGSFTSTFTFIHSTGGADGVAFVLQNSSNGSSAVGGSGSALGVAEDSGLNYIKNGIGVTVDAYHGLTGFTATTQTNGAGNAPDYYNHSGSGYTATTSTNNTTTVTNLNSDGSFTVTDVYNGLTKTYVTTLKDNTTNLVTSSTQNNIDIASILGGTAGGSATGYIGFTGATGGISSTNNVSAFSFTDYAPVAITNPVVTAASTTSTFLAGVATGASNPAYGSLNLGTGSTLNVSPTGTTGTAGYNASFTSLTLTGASTINVANTSSNAPGNVVFGSLNDLGTPATLTVGTGTVTLSASATSLVVGSMINVSSGTTLNLNANGSTGSATVNDAGTVSLGASQTLTIAGAGALVLNGNTATLAPTTFAGPIINGTSAGAVDVATGLVTLSSPNSSYTGGTVVAAGATLNTSGAGITGFGNLNVSGTVNYANPGTGTIGLRVLNNIVVNSGGLVTLGAAPTHSGRTLLIANSVSVAPTGSIDLSNNDLDLNGSSSSLSAVTQLVANGYNLTGGGNWQGSGGITSSAAAADNSRLTALAVVQNNQGGTPLFYAASGSNPASLFDGIVPGASDVLVKYTYFGDANLDGVVNGSDYSLIDNAYEVDMTTPGALTGWYNGDFNYDGVIDGSDYALIDNAFNNQGPQLTSPNALVATETAQIAGPASAVPEPASLGLVAVATAGLMARRRRRI